MRLRWLVLYVVSYLACVAVLALALFAVVAVVYMLATGNGDCWSSECGFPGDFLSDDSWFITRVVLFHAVAAAVLWPVFWHRLRKRRAPSGGPASHPPEQPHRLEPAE